MKIAATHLTRYRIIAALLWKQGRSDIARQMNMEEGFGVDLAAAEDGQLPTANSASTKHEASPENFADDFEAMGSTYVKLGQVLAGRPDRLLGSYFKARARSRDNVKPFRYADVEEIVMTEPGARISKAFAHFDVEPLAAASLGQVHRGTLRDGRAVM